MKKLCALLVVLLCVLAGCRQAEEPTAAPATTPLVTQTTEDTGGVLTLAMNKTSTLNPLLNADETVDRVLRLLFEPLVKLDESGKPIPNIAKSWSYDATGQALTLTIDTGKKWHNGAAITAADVVYSLNTLAAAPENAVYRACLAHIANYSASSDDTVVITFTEVYGGNLTYLVFPVISAAYYGGADAVNSANDLKPMGCGPYAFSSLSRGKELILEKSANSFVATPSIDKIRALFTGDSQAAAYAFQQGVIDAHFSAEPDLVPTDGKGQAQAFGVTTNQYEYMGFSFRNATLQDVNIRRALALAMPRDEILETAYLSGAVAADSPVRPDSWLHADEDAGEYDPDAAAALLEAAGWVDSDGDAYREKTIGAFSDRLELTLLVNQENVQRLQAAERIQAAYEKIGVRVKLDEVDAAAYWEKLQKGDFDLFLGGWDMSAAPDLKFLLATGASGNYGGYSSAFTDLLLTQAYTQVNSEAMAEAWAALQKQIAQDLPVISLAFRQETLFVSKRVGGQAQPLDSNIFNHIEEWTLQ